MCSELVSLCTYSCKGNNRYTIRGEALVVQIDAFLAFHARNVAKTVDIAFHSTCRSPRGVRRLSRPLRGSRGRHRQAPLPDRGKPEAHHRVVPGNSSLVPGTCHVLVFVLLLFIEDRILTWKTVAENEFISGRPNDPAHVGREVPAEPAPPQDPLRPPQRLRRHRLQGRQRIRQSVRRTRPRRQR